MHSIRMPLTQGVEKMSNFLERHLAELERVLDIFNGFFSRNEYEFVSQQMKPIIESVEAEIKKRNEKKPSIYSDEPDKRKWDV